MYSFEAIFDMPYALLSLQPHQLISKSLPHKLHILLMVRCYVTNGNGLIMHS
jgi:hypothetical protein